MIVYFNNDGTYKQDAVKAPVLVDDKPIGFISEVNEERVTCYLWDRYVSKVEGLPNGNPMGREFRAISVEVNSTNIFLENWGELWIEKKQIRY